MPDWHLRRSFESDDSLRCFKERSKSFAASQSSSNADRNRARENSTTVEDALSGFTKPAGASSVRLCFSQNRSCNGLSSRQSSRCSGLMRFIVTRQRTAKLSDKVSVAKCSNLVLRPNCLDSAHRGMTGMGSGNRIIRCRSCRSTQSTSSCRYSSRSHKSTSTHKSGRRCNCRRGCPWPHTRR